MRQLRLRRQALPLLLLLSCNAISWLENLPVLEPRRLENVERIRAIHT
jgi:hypothetical protein